MFKVKWDVLNPKEFDYQYDKIIEQPKPKVVKFVHCPQCGHTFSAMKKAA